MEPAKKSHVEADLGTGGSSPDVGRLDVCGGIHTDLDADLVWGDIHAREYWNSSGVDIEDECKH